MYTCPAQETDPDLVQFQTNTSSLKLPLSTSDGTILCDVSTGTPHPYIPEQFCRSVFDSLHSLQHLVTAHFVWQLKVS